MDRIDVLIAHHTGGGFPASFQRRSAVDTGELPAAYLAARTAFWLTIGGFAGFVYAYGWLVR